MTPDDPPPDQTDPPDIATLAQRSLDLWSRQMAALASDPALTDAMGRTMAAMTQAAQGMAQTARAAEAATAPPRAPKEGAAEGGSDAGSEPGPTPTPGGASPRSSSDASDASDASDPGWSRFRDTAPASANPHADAPPGAAPPGAAPSATDRDVRDMARRLDHLERRTALLEAALGGLLARLRDGPEPDSDSPPGTGGA